MAKVSGIIAALSLVVGLAVGGAGGFLVGASQSRDTPVDAAAPAASAVEPRADAPRAEQRAPRPRAGETVDVGSIRIDVPDAPRGDGRITGFVRTEKGEPLTGVLVRATPVEQEAGRSGTPVDTGAPPADDVAQQVRDLVTQLRRDAARRRDATTDASGAFEVTGLPEGSFYLGAWLVGWRVERAGGRTWTPLRPGARCDFVAKPIRYADVTILLPDGTSPSMAYVTWGDDGRSVSTAEWHRDSPRVEIPPGTYKLHAAADVPGREGMWMRNGGSPLYSSDPQTVTVPDDGPAKVTVHLTAQPGILVRLSFAGPERPRDVRIAALALDDGQQPDPSRLLGEGDAVHATWVQDTSEGALSGLEPGTYLVGVTFRGGRVGPTAVVTVGNSLVTKEFTIAGDGVREWVKVWVRAPDGEIARDVTLRSGCRSKTGSGEADIDASPEADGSWRVEHYENGAPTYGNSSSSGGELEIGGRTYYVGAKSERYGEAEATYDPSADTEVTVRFSEPARLHASIDGFASSPERDRASLTLETDMRERSEGFRSWDATLDEHGVATFPPVAPGTYVLVLHLLARDDEAKHGRRRNWNQEEVARKNVTLGAGEESASIAIPRMMSFVVALETRGGGESLQLQRIDADGVPSGVVRDLSAGDDERELHFDDIAIAPGRYRLVLRDVGDMWVDLPGPERIVFRPRPFNALQVRTEGQEGYLGEAGLRNGDVVVAIDGTELENKLQTDACIAVARSHGTAKLSVVRGGRRFELTVDPKRLDDGGRLAPWVR